jgi:hypothetical protein
MRSAQTPRWWTNPRLRVCAAAGPSPPTLLRSIGISLSTEITSTPCSTRSTPRGRTRQTTGTTPRRHHRRRRRETQSACSFTRARWRPLYVASACRTSSSDWAPTRLRSASDSNGGRRDRGRAPAREGSPRLTRLLRSPRPAPGAWRRRSPSPPRRLVTAGGTADDARSSGCALGHGSCSIDMLRRSHRATTPPPPAAPAGPEPASGGFAAVVTRCLLVRIVSHSLNGAPAGGLHKSPGASNLSD